MPFSICPLKRLVFSVTGDDARLFLQGLFTQDLQKVSPSAPLYSLLLTPQGKFLYDFFLFQDSHNLEEIFIDCAQEDGDALMAFLKRYQLRSNVIWKIHEGIKVYATAGAILVDGSPFAKLPAVAHFSDPRLSGLSWRFYTDADSGAKEEMVGHPRGSQKEYRKYLLEQGIPESGWGLSQDKSIPLECGMMELGAIDWEKGCYLGQELTARTKYRGVVRKRLLPGSLTCNGGESPQEGDLLYWKDKVVGRALSICENLALFLVRLEDLPSAFCKETFDLYAKPQEDLESQGSFSSKAPKSMGKVSLHQPAWLKIDLLS